LKDNTAKDDCLGMVKGVGEKEGNDVEIKEELSKRAINIYEAAKDLYDEECTETTGRNLSLCKAMQATSMGDNCSKFKSYIVVCEGFPAAYEYECDSL
jgi:hypothetical protein